MRKRSRRMKINPYELHPEVKKEFEKKDKKLLTKQKIFVILNEEIEKVQSLGASVWGLTREDIIESLENIREKIEELESE